MERCTRYNIMRQSLSVTCAGRWYFPGIPVSSTNKTDHHDLKEILLKVALDTITSTLSHSTDSRDNATRGSLLWAVFQYNVITCKVSVLVGFVLLKKLGFSAQYSVDHCLSFCSFPFVNCIVFPSSNYGFWLYYSCGIFRLFFFTIILLPLMAFRLEMSIQILVLF